jgi:glycosyltransferase involved in cell wall biosynthesis
VVVPSAWAKRQLVDHEGVPERLVRVIHNGAHPHEPVRGRAAVREELGLSAEDEVVVIAAMLRPEKAHDVAIEALARLADQRPHLRLLVVGGGPTDDPAGTRPQLERQAERLGVAARVRFAGRRGDVSDVVAACDVALLPSAGENLPLAVLEYMEAGTPVVATTVGGVPELIDDGVHGLLVPPGDPVAMAEAIDRTLRDRDAAAARARAARERRRTEFSWDRIAAQTRALYAELLERACR